MSDNRPYDITSAESLVDYAKFLEGKSLGEVRYLPTGAQNVRNKGRLGMMVEEYFFQYKPGANREHEPDFNEAGVELKVTGVLPNMRPDEAPYKAKERLVLTMISYVGLADEEWETSTFLKKCRLMLLLFYLYQKEIAVSDLKFVMEPLLWDFDKVDLEIIERDWRTIQQKIFDGKAHELSEGDTFYLGACRKGPGGIYERLREQPFSEVPAKSRAFSLKPSYVNVMINTHWKKQEQSQLLLTSIEAEKGIEEVTVSRFDGLQGMSVVEIAEKFGFMKVPGESKSYFADLALKIIGSPRREPPEFDKAGIKMKTIRLQTNGKPRESMSFPYFKFDEIEAQKWEESELFDTLERKFFFVVFQYDDDGVLRFMRVLFWNMPYTDREEARSAWEKTKRAIHLSDTSGFPKVSNSSVVHVRPHARNSEDVLPLPDGTLFPKQSFWLNAGYIADQVG